MSDKISKYAIIARHARSMTDECGGYYTDNYNRMCEVVADVLSLQQANGDVSESKGCHIDGVSESALRKEFKLGYKAAIENLMHAYKGIFDEHFR